MNTHLQDILVRGAWLTALLVGCGPDQTDMSASAGDSAVTSDASAGPGTSASASASASVATTDGGTSGDTIADASTGGDATTGASSPCDACAADQLCVARLTGDVCGFEQSYQFVCVGVPAACEDELSCSGSCLEALCGAHGSCETYDCDPDPAFGVDFVCGFSQGECSVWEQDCPEGETCVNDTTCEPAGDVPEGEGCAGPESCAAGLVCATLAADGPRCVPVCAGSELAPDCSHAALPSACVIMYELAPVCLPVCDPLAGACATNGTCVYNDGAPDFVCVLDTSGGEALPGVSCTSQGACGPGLACVDASLLPSCDAGSCCTPWCDYAAIDADLDGTLDDGADSTTGCEALPETVCTAWFDPLADAPEAFKHVGVCVVAP